MLLNCVMMQKLKMVQRKILESGKKNSSTKELTKEISSSGGITPELLYLVNMKGNYITRGTYAHPDLIPHIASWASPLFAVRVSKIVNKYFIKKALKEKEKLIKKKDDKINKLFEETKEQTFKIDELLSKNNKMDKRIKRLLHKNDDLYDQNEEIINKVDLISNDRVVTTGNFKNNHMLVIIKNNDDVNEYDEDDIIYDYHALRVMKKSYNQRLITHKNRHPNMKIIMKISYSPNSMNLWTRIKSKLGSGKNKKIIYDNCKFNLKNQYDKETLINDIQKIHDERLNYDDID